MTALPSTAHAATFSRVAKLLTEIHDRASAAVDDQINEGARLMLAEPWRIDRALYPHDRSIAAGMDAATKLAVCNQKIERMLANAEAGHWAYDHNRMIALRQAKRALKALAFEGTNVIRMER